MFGSATETAPDTDGTVVRIVEVDDERTRLAEEALGLIESAFAPSERQPINQIAMEIGEKRLGLLTSYDFHLFAALSEDDRVVGVSSGVYLGGVNTGFVTYLAVREEYRARKLGRRMRIALIDGFRADARLLEWDDLAAVVGEVRLSSPWLARLVRERDALPLDLTYYHPGIAPGESKVRWVLYRQPVGDHRPELPATEVRQLLYAVWRRAYRIRWPLDYPAYQTMLEELEGRVTVGAHAEVAG